MFINERSAPALPPALSRRTDAEKGKSFFSPHPSGAIAELGRHLNEIMERHNELDEKSLKTPWDSPEHAAIEAEMDALHDESWELRERVLELPARTLADCAVQASVIGEYADLWNGSVFTDEFDVKADLAAIRRAAASVVMALANLGELDLDRLAAGDLRTCCEREVKQ